MSLFVPMKSQSVYSKVVRYMRNNGGYSLSTAKYGYINKGEKFYNYKTFSAGLEYAIVAYSENQNVDVDLYLYDYDGYLKLKDTGSGEWALLNFSTWEQMRMKIVVKNYSYYGNAKCEVLIFYR